MITTGTSPAKEDQKQTRSFGEEINKWVQTVGIVIAALWGAYSFIYKEIVVPHSAPINITMNLQLKKLGKGDLKKGLVPIEMHVSATNPSSRKIYLLSSVWTVSGVEMAPNGPSADFNNQASAAINAADTIFHQKYVAVKDATIQQKYAVVKYETTIAAGRLFADTFLNPNETLANTIIFYVPPDQFDRLEAAIGMESTDQSPSQALKTMVTIADDGNLKSTQYMVTGSGQRREMIADEKEKYNIQISRSRSELSLRE